MRFGDIDIPPTLLDAQLEGEFAVFVGAGASRPRPASLPSFDELVRLIAQPSGVERKRREPPDSFLGRLQGVQYPVHQEVARIIAEPTSRPTPLHDAIVGLFPLSVPMRIVTTNFDTHLTTSARSRWPSRNILEYRAPALPPGDNFEGIVYVHGSVQDEPKTLVLTDGDFGRAYLTQGYARRFLMGLFQVNKVLFVGYSHRDTVLTYLARGLPPDTKRFAFSEVNDAERWKALGVEPILYTGTPRTRQKPVRESLEAWSRYANMGFADHERRISEIVEAGPQVDRPSQDYLRARIGDADTVGLFCDVARDPAWLTWISDHPRFAALFNTDDYSETANRLSWWFAERFMAEHADEALAVVAAHGSALGPVLWNAIGQRMHISRPPADTLRRWLPVLLQSAPERTNDYLDYLLRGCRAEEDDLAAVLLFDFLTTPRARLRGSLFPYGERPRVHVEIEAAGDPYWLAEAVENVFAPRLQIFASRLLAIATKNIEAAHSLIVASSESENVFDPQNYRRAAIEQHDQDSMRRVDWHDFLIDVAKASVEWAIVHDPRRADAFFATWLESKAPLLRRLAIHTMRIDPRQDSDARIVLILDRGLLFETAVHHEVYVLLGDAYPSASVATRQQVLAAIDQGPSEPVFADRPDLLDRVRFDLCAWLLSFVPDDHDLAARRAALLSTYPEWRPSDHPDLTSWMEPSVRSEVPSPLSVEQLLAMDPGDSETVLLLTSKLDAAEPGGTMPFESEREALLSAISAATSKEAGWGIKLAGSLSSRDLWPEDLWLALIDGWWGGGGEKADWPRMLSLIEGYVLTGGSVDPIARLLEDAVRSSPPRLPVDVLDQADRLAQAVWSHLSQGEAAEDEDGDGTEDWLAIAINRPAGQLTIYLLQSLALRRSSLSEGFPVHLRTMFGAILDGSSSADALGRSVLASHLQFLHAVDRDWARSVIIERMKWELDPIRARQMWDGFLAWARLNPSLADDLSLTYESVFGHTSELGRQRDRFCEHMAVAVFLRAANPMSDGWLMRFLASAEEEDAVAFTRHVSYQLRQLPPEAVSESWGSWLRPYWSARVRGIPRPLGGPEASALLDWLPELATAFSQGIDLAVSGPLAGGSGLFYRRLLEMKLADQFPGPTTSLLAHTLEGEERPFWECDSVEALLSSSLDASDGVEVSTLEAIRGHLLRLQCAGVANWLRQTIETRR